MTDKMTPDQYHAEVEAAWSEHDHQCRLVQWCDEKGIPIIAIPNGGHRHKATAARLKAEGVRPGFPDLEVPVVRVTNRAAFDHRRRAGDYGRGVATGCGILFIELKKPGGRVRKEQRAWLERLRSEGHRAEVAYGWRHAAEIITDHVGS